MIPRAVFSLVLVFLVFLAPDGAAGQSIAVVANPSFRPHFAIEQEQTMTATFTSLALALSLLLVIPQADRKSVV